jgi:hypothetical protein
MRLLVKLLPRDECPPEVLILIAIAHLIGRLLPTTRGTSVKAIFISLCRRRIIVIVIISWRRFVNRGEMFLTSRDTTFVLTVHTIF